MKDLSNKKLTTSCNLLGQSSTLDEVFLSGVTSPPLLYDMSLKNGMEGGVHVGKIVPAQILVEGSDVKLSGDDIPTSVSKAQGTCLSCFQVFISSLVIIAVICCTLVFCRQYIRAVLMWMETLDMYFSCTIYLLLFLLVSFPMVWGYLLLIVSAGYLYGLICGVCIVMFCASCGVLLSHVTLKRTCNKRILDKFYNDKVAAIVRVVESDQGLKVVTLARLTPIPFGLQNAIFAMTNVHRAKYCLASTVGLVPMVVLNCYLGSTLRSMRDVFSDGEETSTAYLIFAVQIVLTVVFMIFVIRKARQELAKTVDNVNSTSSPRKSATGSTTHASFQMNV